MSGETQDGPETSSRSAGWGWAFWLGVVLLLYVLCSGPVAMMVTRQPAPDEPAWNTVVIVYRPMVWAWRETPLHKPLGMYWHLWIPERIDAQGNFKYLK